MAEFTTQPLKRSREEEHEEETQQIQVNNSNSAKRHKSPYNDILSILEEEEESDPVCVGSGPPGSDIFTTLQQELLQGEEFGSNPVPAGSGQTGSEVFSGSTIATTTSGSVKEDELEDDRSSVIRHLLEASDDELGIPSGDGTNGGDLMHDVEKGINGGDFPFALCDGLWEFEDEASNFYYSLLQSELFM